MTSASDVGGSVSDIALQTAAGTSLFNGAYNAKSFASTAASAGTLIQGLPSGAAKTALAGAAGFVTGALSGAAFGTAIFPGIGTVVGAAVGVIVQLVQDIMSAGPPPAPEGEFRSTAEIYCFPARSIGSVTALALSVGDAGSKQVGVMPATWPWIRRASIGYQASGDPDPYSGVHAPLPFNFQAGWVPPPGSTDDSTAAAFALAQAYLAGDNVTSNLISSNAFQNFGINASNSIMQGAIRDARDATELIPTSDAAHALLVRWYGSTFPPAPFAVIGGNGGAVTYSDAQGWVSIDPTLSDLAYALKWKSVADALNKTAGADLIYYVSKQHALLLAANLDQNRNPSSVAPVYQAARTIDAFAVKDFGGHCTQLLGMPDTTLCGLAEIAYLVSIGSIPSAGADLVAYHYVLGLAWLWRHGQQADIDSASPQKGSYLPLELHSNFARLLGRLAPLIKASQASKHVSTQTTKGAVPSAGAKSAVVPSAGAKSAVVPSAGAKSAVVPSAGATTVVGGAVKAVLPPTKTAPLSVVAAGANLMADPTPLATPSRAVTIVTAGALAVAGAVLFRKHLR